MFLDVGRGGLENHFRCWYGGAALCQAFKPLEGVVDKNPVFVIVRIGASIVVDIIANCRNFQIDVWEFIKIGGIIYRFDFYRNCSWAFTNVLPIYALTEKTQSLDVI